jgi:hypothetical protein
MITFTENPQTLDQVQLALERQLGNALKSKKPAFSIDRPSNSLRLTSHGAVDFFCAVGQTMLLIQAKSWKLNLNLEKFQLKTEYSKDQFSVWIQSDPEATHRYFDSALRQIAETRHPAFYSRILRAFLRLEDDLSASFIDEVTAAPTDFLVALEALTSSSESSQLVAEDPFVAAKLRGLKRKKGMLEAAGGTLTSEQVADVLGISRQAVDKRRASYQLLALTQGKRGYSYPSFQFEDGKTLPGLEDVLAELKALDPWMQMVFFTSPHERLGGTSPLERLRKGGVEEAKAAAVDYGEQGSL